MKKILALFTGALSILINFTAGAQQNNNDGKSLLWQITGKNLSKPSYLFGTIHMICKDDYLWTEKMKNSLDKSEKICMEMDMDDPNLMMEVAAGMIDHTGKKLSSYFTPEQYEQLKKYFKDNLTGMDVSDLEMMKPAALMTFISAKSMVCDNPVSYEERIMQTATQDKKEIIGLEEVKEQLDVLASMPADSIVKEVLDEMAANNADDKAEYEQMITAYKNQDLPALYTLIKQSKELGGGDLNAFLDDRNKKWISRMADKMKTSSVFFAVGAGHLWGNNGVIQLLRANGYKVEAIK